MYDLRRLAKTLPKPNDKIFLENTNRRQGTITSVDDTVNVSVSVGGGTARSARCLNSYIPTVGDTVEILQIGYDLIVLGGIRGRVAGPSSGLQLLDGSKYLLLERNIAQPIPTGTETRINWDTVTDIVTPPFTTTSSGFVSDAFARADSNTTLGTAPTGQAWSANSGVWGIQSGVAKQVSLGADTGGFAGAASVDGGSTSQIVEVDVLNTPLPNGGGVGVCARLSNGTNYWFAFVYRDVFGANYIYAGKYVAAGITYSIANAVSISAQPSWRIRLEVDASNNWKVYVDGVQKGSTVTDSFNSTATRCGLITDQTLGPFLDNFHATFPTSAIDFQISERGVYAIGANVKWAANSTGSRQVHVTGGSEAPVGLPDWDFINQVMPGSFVPTTGIGGFAYAPLETDTGMIANVRQDSGSSLDLTYASLLVIKSIE